MSQPSDKFGLKTALWESSDLDMRCKVNFDPYIGQLLTDNIVGKGRPEIQFGRVIGTAFVVRFARMTKDLFQAYNYDKLDKHDKESFYLKQDQLDLFAGKTFLMTSASCVVKTLNGNKFLKPRLVTLLLGKKAFDIETEDMTAAKKLSKCGLILSLSL